MGATYLGVPLGVRTPTLDLFQIEPPFTAEFECRQLVLFEHPVNRRPMHVQVLRNIIQCQVIATFKK